MNTDIEAILFDFGGVFTDSPFAAATELGRRLGAPPARVLQIVFGPYHEDSDHPWHRLERGELSLENARSEILKLGKAENIDIDPYAVLAELATGDHSRPAVTACVYDLRRRGYKTAIVTNNAHEFREIWRAMLPVDDMFDVIVDSSEQGVRKPDPEIFRRTLSLLGDVRPERAAFLDDYAGNVEAATRLGLHGILVENDPTSALEALADLLGVPVWAD